MADLSKLSQSDREAVLKGDLSSVSTEGLLALRGGAPAAAAPAPSGAAGGMSAMMGGARQSSEVPGKIARTIADLGVEAGGGAVGQMAGAIPLLSVPSGGASVPVGGFIGGGIGNTLAQLRQLASGERKAFSAGEVIGSAVASAIPGAPLAKAAARKVAGEALKQAAGNVAGVAAQSAVDAGSLPSRQQMVSAAAASALGTGIASRVDTGSTMLAASNRRRDMAIRDATLEAARKEGYIILPSSLKDASRVNGALEYIAGRAQTMEEVVARNDAVTKALAKRAVGIPAEDVLDLAALENIRKIHGEVYGEVAKTSSRANALLERFKTARDNARGFFLENDRTGTKQSLDDARRWDAEAKVLEKALDKELTNSGKKDLVRKFGEAREVIAKAHVIEDAFNTGSGSVRADIIAKRRASGKTILTGELDTIARFSDAFPRSSATQSEKATSAVVHPLVVGTAATSGTYLGGPSVGATMGAMALFAPAAVRPALLSSAYQNMMVRPNYATPVPQDLGAMLSQLGAQSFGRFAGRPPGMPTDKEIGGALAPRPVPFK